MAYNKLFIDSDVLLDGILVREPYFKNSLDVILLADNERFTCFTSVHCIVNIHYLIKKRLGEQPARQTLRRLTAKLKIVKEDSDTIQQALNSSFADFEDAVQFYAAESANADVIITRNTKDYKNSTIPVLTAEQFLREILK
jgi:predicted nucleic acid-binding protein